MYYYNSAYTTYNYAAGALGILVVAVVLTALLLVLVLPKQKDGHLPFSSCSTICSPPRH